MKRPAVTPAAISVGITDPQGIAWEQFHSLASILDAFIALRRRIELMLSLPLANLDRLAIQTEIKAIGTQ